MNAQRYTDEDLGILADGTYLPYFAQLIQAFQMLKQRFLAAPRQLDEPGVDPVSAEVEAKVITGFLNRLLATLEAVRYRAIFNVDDQPVLIDLTESGFPNAHEVRRLEVAQEDAGKRLAALKPMKALKRQLVDQLIRTRTDPPETLASLAEHAYLDRLGDGSGLFLLLAPGTFVELPSKTGHRRYVYSWGCYDTETNRPYISLLTVDQDPDQDPLDVPGPYRSRFLEVVHEKGNRAVGLHRFMLEVDATLDGIYPKFVKRVCLGPYYSELVFEARDQAALSNEEQDVRALLAISGNPQDFILCGSEEIIFSAHEERVSGSVLANLGLRKGIRQVFAVPTESIADGNGVSAVHRYAVLPHAVLQNLPASREGLPPELGADAAMHPYGEKGVLYV